MSHPGEWRRIHAAADYYRFLRPLNAKREKGRFFAALASCQVYEPQLTYELPTGRCIEGLHERLQRVRCGDDAIVLAFRTMFQQIVNLLEAHRVSNLRDLQRLSGQLFGSHRKLNRSRAEQFLHKLVASHKPSSNLEATELIPLLSKRIKSVGLSGWKLRLNPKNVSEVEIYTAKRLITVSPKARFSKHSVDRLLAHEIVGHAFQTMNGMRNSNYDELFAGYLGTEQQQEGLAVFCEVATLPWKHSVETLTRYLSMALAVKYAATAGFFETFTRLNCIIKDPEAAYLATLRAKLGFRDTSQVGCFQNSMSYLIGLHKTIEMVRRNQGVLGRLYAGGFPHDVIKYVREVEPPPLQLRQGNLRRCRKMLVELFGTC